MSAKWPSSRKRYMKGGTSTWKKKYEHVWSIVCGRESAASIPRNQDPNDSSEPVVTPEFLFYNTINRKIEAAQKKQKKQKKRSS